MKKQFTKILILVFVLMLFVGVFFSFQNIDAYSECSEYGLWVQYDYLTNTCKCTNGYVWDEDIFGKPTCVSCSSKYGYHSKYDYLANGCVCEDGYILEKGLFGSDYECVKKSLLAINNNLLWFSSISAAAASSGKLFSAKQGLDTVYFNYIGDELFSAKQGLDTVYFNYSITYTPPPTYVPPVTNTPQKTPDELCKEDYGNHSYYTGENSDDGNYLCNCEKSYEWRNDICAKIICPLNATLKNGKCVCDEEFIKVENGCITKDQSCKNDYGQYSYYTKTDTDGTHYCDCIEGYEWNDNQTFCIEKVVVKEYLNPPSNLVAQDNTVEEEKDLITKVDNNLSKRVSGNILLQVEKNGEGWYVYPDDKKKYYLGRPVDAFSIMKNLGLGIKHSELNNYLNAKFPSILSGKIMLDVEENGEAYYVNPNDLKGYYLNRPVDAFDIMREFGLGITNTDIRQIDVGEIE